MSHQQRVTGKDRLGRPKKVKPVDDGLTEAERVYLRRCKRKKIVPRLGTPASGGSWGLTKDRMLPG